MIEQYCSVFYQSCSHHVNSVVTGYSRVVEPTTIFKPVNRQNQAVRFYVCSIDLSANLVSIVDSNCLSSLRRVPGNADAKRDSDLIVASS